MKYGLIGERLGHSFSAEIHSYLASSDYTLTPLRPDELEQFLLKRDFCAVNVTIPYKQAVIPYLDGISPSAQAIGAVNVIVNRCGALYGFNSDYDGLKALISHLGTSLMGKKVLVAGSGGTSHTACCLARDEGAAFVSAVSRSGRDGAITYDSAYFGHSDADIIINCTPCGMFPDTDGQPISLDSFKNLEAVVDVIFNPLRTRLVLDAQSRGIKAEGGLYMLVAQAVKASELFIGTEYPKDTTEKIYKKLLMSKQNIVLIGMPSCGKSAVGKVLAAKLKRPFIDLDDKIVEKAGISIKEIFARYGEKTFRDMESDAVKDVQNRTGCIIACGGGTVLRNENVLRLKANGRLFMLDRAPEKLIPTSSRPLSANADDLKRLYEQRRPIYLSVADSVIKCEGVNEKADMIIKELGQ